MSNTCESCIFWERMPDYPDNGKCHFFPPRPIYQVALDGSGNSYGDNLWPYTAKYDWCGQWALSTQNGHVYPRPVAVAAGDHK